MKLYLYSFLALLWLTATSAVYGADGGVTYTSLTSVPGLDGTELSTEAYVNALYYLSITFGGLLAVVYIIYGGVEWTFSDRFTEKSSAKNKIFGALFGLLIILSAVLLLETVNKNLTTLSIFGNAPAVTVIDNNVPVDSRTACQKNSSSKECCDQKGGNYIVSVNGKNTTPRCSLGEETPLPPAAGETDEEKRLFCMTTAGMEWKNGVCRRTTGKQAPFPPGYTDADGKDDFDRQIFCSDALKGDYNPDTDTCTVN